MGERISLWGIHARGKSSGKEEQVYHKGYGPSQEGLSTGRKAPGKADRNAKEAGMDVEKVAVVNLPTMGI